MSLDVWPESSRGLLGGYCGMTGGRRATHKNPDFCKRHPTFASPSVSALPKVWIGVPLRDINGVTFLNFHYQMCV